MTALNRYVGDLSDHHVFRLNQVPYLFLSCGHWQHYHQASDTPERLDYAKMAAITDLLEAATRDVAQRELAGPWEGYDTTPTDLRTMRAALGGTAAKLGMSLENREDIDRMAGFLMSQLGLKNVASTVAGSPRCLRRRTCARCAAPVRPGRPIRAVPWDSQKVFSENGMGLGTCSCWSQPLAG